MMLLRSANLILLIVLLSGCSREGEISGEVFIVTKGRENVKLGLVEIRAIPENDVFTYLHNAEKQRNGELQKIASEREGLRQTLERAQKDLEEDLKDIDRQYEAAKNAYDRRWDNFDKTIYEKVKNAYDARVKERDGRKKALQTVEHRVADLGIREQTLRMELQQRRTMSARPLESEFESLPSGIASAVSNAEGKFLIKLPRHGRFLLAAKTSRSLFQTEEHYCWLVWVSLDGQPAKSVILANHNLASGMSPDASFSPCLSLFRHVAYLVLATPRTRHD